MCNHSEERLLFTRKSWSAQTRCWKSGVARVNVLPKWRDDEGSSESILKHKIPCVACDCLSTPPAVTGRVVPTRLQFHSGFVLVWRWDWGPHRGAEQILWRKCSTEPWMLSHPQLTPVLPACFQKPRTLGKPFRVICRCLTAPCSPPSRTFVLPVSEIFFLSSWHHNGFVVKITTLNLLASSMSDKASP